MASPQICLPCLFEINSGCTLISSSQLKNGRIKILGLRECIALDPIPCSIWSLPQPLEFVSRVVALGLLVYVVV